MGKLSRMRKARGVAILVRRGCFELEPRETPAGCTGRAVLASAAAVAGEEVGFGSVCLATGDVLGS